MKLPDDDLKRSKHVGLVLRVLKCFKLKLYRCICWVIVEVTFHSTLGYSDPTIEPVPPKTSVPIYRSTRRHYRGKYESSRT